MTERRARSKRKDSDGRVLKKENVRSAKAKDMNTVTLIDSGNDSLFTPLPLMSLEKRLKTQNVRKNCLSQMMPGR